MGLVDQVIVKRLPIEEYEEKQTESDSEIDCECIDGIFNEANPNCAICNGTGKIKNMFDSEWTKVMSGEKKVWITRAKIIIDENSVIYDDEDDVEMFESIHGFFQPEEDIRVGDYVIPSGGTNTYIVERVQTVRGLDNIILKECSLKNKSV